MEDEQGKALSFLGTSCKVMAEWPRKVEDEMSTKVDSDLLCPVFRPVNTDSPSIGGSEGGEIERMLMQPCAR